MPLCAQQTVAFPMVLAWFWPLAEENPVCHVPVNMRASIVSALARVPESVDPTRKVRRTQHSRLVGVLGGGLWSTICISNGRTSMRC